MRKLIMKMSVTLDGYVCGPKGENDWVFKTGDEQSLAWSVDKIKEAGLIIIGRKTFEMIAPYWISASGPFAEPMNTIPKATFSKSGFAGIPAVAGQSAAAASWSEARVFNGDLAEAIKKLKAEPGGPIVAIGGAGFMKSLIATGLIDEFTLAIHPVILGGGLTIFGGNETPQYLKLVDVKTFPKGTMAKTYSSM